MKFPLYVLVFSLIFSLFSCSNSVDPDISKLLDTRENAFEDKNADSYQELILPEYMVKVQTGVKKKDDVLKDFKLNTSPFDSIEMSHKDRTVQKENNKAKVVQKTFVVLSIDEQKINYEITEVILLEKENNVWRISKESSMDLFRGFVFGKQQN